MVLLSSKKLTATVRNGFTQCPCSKCLMCDGVLSTITGGTKINMQPCPHLGISSNDTNRRVNNKIYLEDRKAHSRKGSRWSWFLEKKQEVTSR